MTQRTGSIKNILARIQNFLADLLFPKFCLNCRRQGLYLCDDCTAMIDILSSYFCLCYEPLRLGKPGKCPVCQRKPLNGLFFAVSYENLLVQALIRQFKYPPYAKELGKTLSDLIVSHFLLIEKQVPADFALIPVPVENRKLRSRGFNQSREIAFHLAQKWRLPLINNCLIKIKNTEPQMKLSGLERKNNLDDAFACRNQELIKDKKIFLVDDVYTTGATMEECSRVLKQAGARQVWGIAAARSRI
ncbi:MAG: ComF family protein [bacterium]|nr:ComF family protein [bacterium]